VPPSAWRTLLYTIIDGTSMSSIPSSNTHRSQSDSPLRTVPSESWSALAGAAFLMATSAIGPGFLTQTALFTSRFGADFASAILLSALLDVAVQLTVWRVIAASGLRAPILADKVLRGSGRILTLTIVLGGFAFNIGNVAGAGLGLESALGLDTRLGAVVSAILACGIFVLHRAMRAMDRFAQVMGALMIGITLYVAWASSPPLVLAATRAFVPQHFDVAATLTLVGGTVGGYITFAGGHRLVDAGLTGVAAIRRVTIGASLGVAVATCMRVLLFVAALGVCSVHTLEASNPAASVFTLALGNVGTRLFGVVMWAAAVTSIIGSAYTSVSFLRSFIPRFEQHQSVIVIIFIIISTALFLILGKPVQILVLAGIVNSFVIPFALVLMLVAAYKPSIVGVYRHPLWLTVAGAFVATLLLGMSLYALFT
jgi:Mn2+/Fe2+ NRAMP family transporter